MPLAQLRLEDKSISGVRFLEDGQPQATSTDRDGKPFPTRQATTQPFMHAISFDYDKAWKKEARKDGTLHDQSMLFPMYGTCYIQNLQPDKYESAFEDPAFVAGYTFKNFDRARFRANKSTPKMLQNLGIISYRQQYAAGVVAIDIDYADVFPKTNPAYQKFYKNNDLSVSEKCPGNDEIYEYLFTDLFEKIKKKYDWFDKCAVFYTTENGCRLVYHLSRPIPVIGCKGCLEDKIRGIQLLLAAEGFPPDAGCCDWTRLMRYPACWKGNKKIGRGDGYYFSWGGISQAQDREERPLEILAVDPDFLPEFSSLQLKDYYDHAHWESISKVMFGSGRIDRDGNELPEVDVDCGGMPTDEETNLLLYVDGGATPTNCSKICRDLLRDASKKNPKTSKIGYFAQLAQDLYALIYEKSPILQEIAKNHGKSGLHYGNYYSVWDFCAFFRDRISTRSGGFTPQFVYAVLVGPYLREMEQRALVDTKNARSEQAVKAETWRAVQHCYPVQFQVREQMEQEEQAIEAEQGGAELFDGGMDRDETLKFIKTYLEEQNNIQLDETGYTPEKLLVVTSNLGKSAAQIKDNKLVYSDPVTTYDDLVPALRDSGHCAAIFQEIKDEEIRVRKPSEIMLHNGTCVGKNTKASRLIDANKVEFTKSDNGYDLSFVQKLPGVAKDIEPAYHQRIHEFLQAFGGQYSELLFDWLAKLCEIDRPLPALYIHGDSGIGKGLFCDGLQLLTARKMAAEFSDALTNFQDFFYDTWFLTIDEDAVGANEFQKDVVGVLRRMIGGQLKHINVKGVKGIKLDGEWRLLVTANNADVFQIKSDLTQEDIEALNGRIFYIDNKANTSILKQILYEAGGANGNEKGPGTYADQWPMKIAQHVKWLQENRQVTAGSRFLIDAPATPWHEHLRITSAGGMIICRAIADIFRDMATGQDYDFVMVHHKKKAVFIRPDLFETHVERNYLRFRGQVTKTLERLSEGSERVRFTVEQRKQKYKTRPTCFRLNIGAVMSALYNQGHDVDFRNIFDDDMWQSVVPDHIRRDISGADHDDIPPPPAANSSNIIPFPPSGALA